MLFNSYTFIFFFIAVLALRNLPLAWSVKKTVLLVSSYIFYAAWNPPFVFLLWISTTIDWWAGRCIYRNRESKKKKKFLLISLALNLGLLCYFKYANFFLQIFVDLVALVGIQFHPIQVDVILPVGISFYTFQTISYTIDIYKGEARPWHSFMDYALYVSFFPQLVAGPIVRAFEFLPQCIEEKKVSFDSLAKGISLLSFGLFQKIVLADGVFAPVAQSLFDSTHTPGFSAAWIGTMAFAGQILCDFSGYSTCAIGSAKCLGFELPDNFRFPYAAIGFRDFWKRWHISLSTWLRDYVYIPLGGNRRGLRKTWINIWLTMLIGGLWHGAALTFVAWGAIHGMVIVLEHLIRERTSVFLSSLKRWQCCLLQVFSGGGTFLMVCAAWTLFRSSTLLQARGILFGMFGFSSGETLLRWEDPDALIAMGALGLILICQWILRNQPPQAWFEKVPWWIRSICLSHMIIFIVLFYGEDRAFIYFQF